jgi:glycosyltransferase involved in cell wall biosynthesis
MRKGCVQSTDEKMEPRVALLSPTGRDGSSRHGGITPVMANLANTLAGQGVDIDLLLFQGSPELPRAFVPSVRAIGLGGGSKLRQALALIRYLKDVRPDALLAAGWRANFVASRARRWASLDTPMWGGIHNTVSAGQKGLPGWKVALKNGAMRRVCSVLDGLVAVSKGVAADFVLTTGAPSSRVKVVYNPIVRSELFTLAEAPCPHPWFASGEPPVILAVGRLARQKDFPALLKAFAKVRATRESRLVILGEGQERRLLEGLVSELGLSRAVDMPGFVENPFSYMKRAAMLALSSEWEGFGNVLVEAMALGTPVVSTDCPHGPREILQDGLLGPLVRVGDVSGLAKALQQVLDQPTPADLLRRGAELFNAENSTRNYFSLFGLSKASEREEVLGKSDGQD